MKRIAILAVLFFSLSLNFSVAAAGEFSWLKNLNIEAVADPSGFRARLATRFRIGEKKVKAIIDDVSKPSDAYMVLRLGELSHRHVDDVMTGYRTHRKKGWGAIAKRLGIKPGSRDFHALKRGHDLGYSSDNSKGKSSGKGKSHKKGRSGKKDKAKKNDKGKK